MQLVFEKELDPAIDKKVKQYVTIPKIRTD